MKFTSFLPNKQFKVISGIFFNPTGVLPMNQTGISVGNEKIDNGLNRIGGKIKSKKTFGSVDYAFIEFLLRKRLGCQDCRWALNQLYLHLKYGKTGALSSSEWAILGALAKHKKDLEIPEVQLIPTGEDDY
jgi:hypothetical protein